MHKALDALGDLALGGVLVLILFLFLFLFS